MEMRAEVTLVALAISFALPTFAQQTRHTRSTITPTACRDHSKT
jgi:hypothetical protein